MRIIAGRFKGVRLVTPTGRGFRPTTDRVREAVFSVLGPAVAGSRALDLFAGSGALGFEALSRNAVEVVFVERHLKTARALEKTAGSLNLADGTVTTIISDACAAVARLIDSGDKFDLIFLDPPYEESWLPQLLKVPGVPDLLAPGGLVIAETSARTGPFDPPHPLEKTFSRTYGDTLIEIFEFRGA